jgi:hypothetical protein
VGQVNWTIQSGSSNTAVFTLEDTDGSLYPLTGLTWEYVVRRDASDLSSAAVITVNETPNAQGVVTVDLNASTVTVTLYPAATATLTQRAVYAHALWADPTDPALATCWVYGGFVVNQVAQP